MAKNKANDHSKYRDWIDPNEVVPYERNAKQHTEKQVRNIANSIRRFGWQQDTVITADNVLVIGHGRRLAALKLGCEMPYHRIDKAADELTDEDIRELRIADNQTNAETGFDLDVLALDTDGLEFEGFEFAFDAPDTGADFFDRENRNDTSRQEGNDEYNEFLDKFEPKKTTDDCYTPEMVYDAVAEWVEQEYGIDRLRFVRPFYPGGDYKNYSYPADCAVVDNPPFSILAEIISWYAERRIRFFLFAPQLTLFSSSSASACCCLPCGADITYENGATVCTSFVTNLENNRVRVIPDLYLKVQEANDKNQEQYRKTLPKYKYPDYVLTAAMCNYMCAHGQAFTVTREDSQHIRYLDSQKEYGDKAIFGSGFLLSEKAAAEKAAAEKAAAEKAAAEKAAAEKAAAHVWELSDREWAIIRGLGK